MVLEKLIFTCIRIKLAFILYHSQKLTQNGLRKQDLKCKSPRRKHRLKLLDIDFGDEFFTLTSKAQVIKAKINRWEFMKII